MNRCECCGKPTNWSMCTRCYEMHDPDSQASSLVTACVQHPERAEALHKALSAKPDPKPYKPPVWAEWELGQRWAPSTGER